MSGWADGHSLIIRGRTRAEVDEAVRVAVSEGGTIAHRVAQEYATQVTFATEEQAVRAFQIITGATT